MKGVLKPYHAFTWFDPVGAKRKAKKLESRLPNLKGCLVVALTYNPKHFSGPLDAFKKGNDKIRRMKDRLKRGVRWKGKLIKEKIEYLRKLEFHKNGWPHFHVILKTRRYLDVMLINHLWGYGLVKVQRIKGKSYPYLFKYVAKSLEEIPDWVKELNSIRIMQPSRGFLIKEKIILTEKQQLEEDQKEYERDCWKDLQRFRKVREQTTIGERMERSTRMGMLVTNSGCFIPLEFTCTYKDHLNSQILDLVEQGRYLGKEQFAVESLSQILPCLKKIPKSLAKEVWS